MTIGVCAFFYLFHLLHPSYCCSSSQHFCLSHLFSRWSRPDTVYFFLFLSPSHRGTPELTNKVCWLLAVGLCGPCHPLFCCSLAFLDACVAKLYPCQQQETAREKKTRKVKKQNQRGKNDKQNRRRGKKVGRPQFPTIITEHGGGPGFQ